MRKLWTLVALLLMATGLAAAEPANPARLKCREAFPGLEAKNLIYFESKGLLLACNDMQMADGRLKLTDASVAMFREGSAPVTIRGPVMFLTTDGLVTSLSELGRRKINGIDIPGQLRIAFTE